MAPVVEVMSQNEMMSCCVAELAWSGDKSCCVAVLMVVVVVSMLQHVERKLLTGRSGLLELMLVMT